MPTASPEESVEAFFRAFNSRDVRAVMALYEPGAALVAQPGQVAEGASALREALNGFLAMKPTLTLEKKRVVAVGDIALSVVRWTLKGAGPNDERVQMAGTSSDLTQAGGRKLAFRDR